MIVGDAHNFGRRVALRADRVAKPRPLLWEWLVLSAKSPLRRLLAARAAQDGLGEDTFAFLPDLTFSFSKKGLGGEVERVTLKPLPKLSRARRLALAAITGRSLALFSWLGVTDLHWENLVLGEDDDGAIVFSPLDVEMILAELSLPAETKLLPDADPEYAEVCQHACGVRRVLPYLGKPVDAEAVVAIASAYRAMLAFLERHASAIADVLARLPALRKTPIRVCLRGTADYVLGADTLWPPLLDEEKEQLARGDIPYFFRLYGRPGIHFYADRALTKIKTLSSEGDVPQLDPMLDVDRALRARSRKKLREEGLFTVIAAFDHAALSGRHASGDLEVAFAARSLTVKEHRRGGLEMRAPRDWSALVSPVYLPCRCGEVRTVFVPAKTKCDASAKRSF